MMRAGRYWVRTSDVELVFDRHALSVADALHCGTAGCRMFAWCQQRQLAVEWGDSVNWYDCGESGLRGVAFAVFGCVKAGSGDTQSCIGTL